MVECIARLVGTPLLRPGTNEDDGEESLLKKHGGAMSHLHWCNDDSLDISAEHSPR